MKYDGYVYGMMSQISIMIEEPDFPSTVIFIESIVYSIFCAVSYPNLIICAISSVILILAFTCHIWVYKMKVDEYGVNNI